MVFYTPVYAVEEPAKDAGMEDWLFEDVSEEAWYYESVNWALENEITTGIGKNQFGVFESCTRAQGLTFLWRADGCVNPRVLKNSFEDVMEPDWFYTSVLWAVENKITTGTSDTTFSPNEIMTRAQFVTFLYRLLGEEPTISKNPFSDVSDDAYYKDAVLWATEKGITTGATETTFEPDKLCLRTEAVTFLWRLYDNQEEEDVQIDDIVVRNPHLPINVADYGVSSESSGYKNSMILQTLIDKASEVNGTVYIPAGEYKFSAIGEQTVGSHCIKMKSNVTIIGDGKRTVLKPIGRTDSGLDMFYFNDYLDYGEATYLENCVFENFVIDAKDTSCRRYTSAGKGFMINLFKNCSWKNVIVKNTDATGFGVDCPIGGSMENCTAINCGKAAIQLDPGASGFGIGFGYSEDEHFLIDNCAAYGNKHFGFFFEHQKRFNREKYQAEDVAGFQVKNCVASNNYYNFGGLLTMKTTYENCESDNALKDGYYFENSKDCLVTACTSGQEASVSFVVVRSLRDGGDQFVGGIVFDNCMSTGTPMGVVIKNLGKKADMIDVTMKNCKFTSIEKTLILEGMIKKLILENNNAKDYYIVCEAEFGRLTNSGNSWPDDYFGEVRNVEDELRTESEVNEEQAVENRETEQDNAEE